MISVHKYFKKIFLLSICFIFYSSSCFAWLEYDESYLSETEPKLYKICTNILKESRTLVASTKPIFEVNLTKQERYFSASFMDFLIGKEEAQYSGIVWRGVWANDKTVATGWMKKDKKIFVDFVNTRDPNITFIGGIRVGASVSVLEKLFGAPISSVSLEQGVFGNLSLDRDSIDFSLEITYDNGVITKIRAWNDYVDDIVPLLPPMEKIDKIRYEIENEKIQELLSNNRNNNKIAVVIILTSLLFGFIASVFVYKLLTKDSVNSDISRESNNQEEQNNEEQQKEQQSVEFEKLKGFVSWLMKQPDYVEFNRWFDLKLSLQGKTSQDITKQFWEHIKNGGRFADIQKIIMENYDNFRNGNF